MGRVGGRSNRGDGERRTAQAAIAVGSYSQARVTAPCGLASASALIGALDDPASYYDARREAAGLVWFRSGFLEYLVPVSLPAAAIPSGLELELEACSDAPGYDPHRPSDVSVWVNHRLLGTWTCPGDFGGRRGTVTPEWWDVRDTQFGMLTHWATDERGTSLDGRPLSDTTIFDVDLRREPFVRVRIGVEPDATHAGGLNLFGRTFGDHPQDPLLRVHYALER